MVSRTLTVLATLVAIVLVGCGGGDDRLSKDAYVKELNSAGKALVTSFNGIDSNIGKAKTPAALGAGATEGSKVLRDSAKHIEGLNPPENAEAANQKLADALNAMADSFEQVGKETQNEKTPNASALNNAVTKLTSSEGIKKIQAAIAELKAKGYNVTN